jgi:hypothetical protein
MQKKKEKSNKKEKSDKIDSFTGSYRWLSNFHPVEVKLDGVTYSSTEHAYQAAKTLNLTERRKVREAGKPGEAKKLGMKVNLRVDWEEIKLGIMEDLVRQKFQYPDLKKALLGTGDSELVEGNTWGDVFYGVCKGKGQNHLGRILMRVREELKKSNDNKN